MTKSSVLSFIYPQLIETRSSEFNQEIKVYKFLGKYFISVDNFTQSGGLVTKIWQKAIEYLSKNNFKASPPQNILIMGLGAGNSILKIIEKWPKSQITAIEIDPVMIKLSHQYNHLEKFQQLDIQKVDVFEWIKKNKTKFDLILVDLYIGKDIPKQADSKQFLQSIKSHLTSRGVVVINRSSQKKFEVRNQDILINLKHVFDSVQLIKTPVNQVYAASTTQK